LKIFIDEDGNTSGLESPLTLILNLKNRKRVSHVEPANFVLNFLFRQIRKRVSDDSWLAEFTRQWPCQWQAKIISGPTLGPFKTRTAAIAAEIRYIEGYIEERLENANCSRINGT
jgi:hypothetical protein